MRVALILALTLAAPALAQDFFTLKGHGGPIMDIAVSPDGQIATASFDNAVGLWDGTTPIWHDGHLAAVNVVGFWAHDMLVSGGDDFQLRVWSDPTVSRVLGQHQGKIVGLATSPSVGLIATASWDGTIGLWPTGSGVENTLDPSKGGADPIYLRGHRQGVNDVVFSADGATLYSASSDGTIRVWDVTTRSERQRLVTHGFGVNKLVLNEAAGWLAYGAVDGGTRLVTPDTGDEIADFTLDRRPILALAYDPVGQQLAVGDGEGYIMIVDTQAMRIAHDFRATLRGPIWALAFSPDGQNIHAGGIEDIVYSWPIRDLGDQDQMAQTPRSFLQDPDSMTNGERQFSRKCSICHTLTQDSARRAGPSLYGLFGRRAGRMPDYSYSETLQGSQIVWSAETINALFDQGPDHYIPGTKMPMQRIASPQDRDDLIDYLARATAQGGD